MPSTFYPFDPKKPKEIVRRYDGNPILTGADFPGDITWVFNSGVVKDERRYVMVCRVEDSALYAYMWVADSDDGLHFTPRLKPVEVPIEKPEFKDYSYRTYYDPRVTKLDGVFYIVHAAHNRHACRLGLFRTEDLENFEWMGVHFRARQSQWGPFPRKGQWTIHPARPGVPRGSGGDGDIWISYSPDLIHWGRSKCVIRRDDFRWPWKKIGPGAVPIRTGEGWLTIFHGVRTQCAQHYVYQLGVFLLDLDEPSRVAAKAERAILVPQMDYELAGQTPSVVFTNAAILEDDGSVKIYYGAADSVQCVALSTLDEPLSVCHNK